MAFEEASAICRGEKDNELPDHAVLTGWLQRVPKTWLPDLFLRVAVLCIQRAVFSPGGMEAFVERAKVLASKTASENSLRLKSGK